MKENGLNPAVIRAGRANLFLSDVFAGCFVNTLDVPLELHNCDGSVGAALGAGVGAGIFSNAKEAFLDAQPLKVIVPGADSNLYNSLYEEWKELLQEKCNHISGSPATTANPKKYASI
ncbi:MAG: hypothetical protein EOO03_15765 [Chitinophagaceae bacterium]|nr:MAG: hypothetical protein EOO03_15765 [Chitinophagaceae bacterium]